MKKKMLIFGFILLVLMGVMLVKNKNDILKTNMVFKSESIVVGDFNKRLNGILASNVSSFIAGDLLVIKVSNVRNVSNDEVLVRDTLTVNSNTNFEMDGIKLYKGEFYNVSDLSTLKQLKFNDNIYTGDNFLLEPEMENTFFYTIYFDRVNSDGYIDKRIFFEYVIERHDENGEWMQEFVRN